MSHSANNVTEHRLHPSKDNLTPITSGWEVYIGSVSGFLFVVGPGASAMQLVAKHANARHMEIARSAVDALNRTCKEDFSAGPEEITAALVLLGWDGED